MLNTLSIDFLDEKEKTIKESIHKDFANETQLIENSLSYIARIIGDSTILKSDKEKKVFVILILSNIKSIRSSFVLLEKGYLSDTCTILKKIQENIGLQLSFMQDDRGLVDKYLSNEKIKIIDISEALVKKKDFLIDVIGNNDAEDFIGSFFKDYSKKKDHKEGDWNLYSNNCGFSHLALKPTIEDIWQFNSKSSDNYILGPNYSEYHFCIGLNQLILHIRLQLCILAYLKFPVDEKFIEKINNQLKMHFPKRKDKLDKECREKLGLVN